MIYLDNAATSFPKPAVVPEAIAEFLSTRAGNPGRAGHSLAVAAQALVSGAREALAELFGVDDPSRVVLAQNATDAINLALWGLLGRGDRVVTTALEHNAVVRPLAALAARRGVRVDRVGAPGGVLDLEALEGLLTAAPTRLVALAHASNVSGAILPVAEVARLAHRHGAVVLLDAAQTAGALPVDVSALGVDLLAFTGHKGLLGPTGVGGLYVAPSLRLASVRQGGTGTRSEEPTQPEELPEGLEAGTPNTVGIAGLVAALRFVRERGVAALRAHEVALTRGLLEGLRDVPGVRVVGPAAPERQVAVVSFTVEGWEPLDFAAALDSSFGVAARAGLHCAPVAHQTLGTFPLGTVRFSPGPFTRMEEIDEALAAVRSLAGS